MRSWLLTLIAAGIILSMLGIIFWLIAIGIKIDRVANFVSYPIRIIALLGLLLLIWIGRKRP